VRSQLNARVVRPRQEHRKPSDEVTNCVASERGVVELFDRE
jgi:hypothetical protein